ncbi:DUF1493 family protein [Serratia marcescens]|uniref:DUF1493 family protein n=1 Tax=Serratia TaxID=613 RepID=UPI001A2AFFA6|nr:DUF1493 family protein [Serratia marcescens]ELQ9439642.1 DUF1493 family protein [Serratia marcescens]ELT5560813.1 DUF1493 family protein [Serratia marcescens]HAT4995414.1 DUF1493 family protein [Serratia marcescens]
MGVEQQVNELIEKHFWEMPGTASLSTGDQPVDPEDAMDFFQEYFDKLHVEPNGFEFRKYFPSAGIPFLPNAILPKYLKTDHHKPLPLTIDMLTESAKAGRWLY